MKHKKMTCFTSLALAVLLSVGSVTGTAVSVLAENDKDGTDIEVSTESSSESGSIQIDNDGIVVDSTEDGITVETEGSTESESESDDLVVEDTEKSVSIGVPDNGEDIVVEQVYEAGQKQPAAVKAENLSDTEQSLVISLWSDADATKAVADGFADVTDGKITVTAKDDTKLEGVVSENTVSFTLAAGQAVEFELNILQESAGSVFAQAKLGEEVTESAEFVWTEKSDDVVIETEEGTEAEEDVSDIVIETTEPDDGFTSIYLGDAQQAEANALNASDFASMRLVMQVEDKSMIPNESDIIGVYGDLYLLRFTSIQQTMNAYVYFKDLGIAVEPDATVEVASGDEADTEIIVQDSEIPMNDESNPMLNVGVVEDSAAKGEDKVIALIDTGTQEHANVIDRVSVIDDSLEGHGHGDAMLEAIVSQNLDAKVLSIRAMDNNGFGTISSLVAAMEYAMEQKVDIINLSLYSRTTLSTSVLKKEIQKAVEMGITVIGAAGNDGTDVSGYVPGSVAEAWIIGAATADGSRLDISNFGETVDYNVVAESTSEATALFTGFVSANGLEGVESVLNQGLIFETNFKEEPELPEVPDEDFSEYTLTDKLALVRYTYVYADKMKEGDTIDSLFVSEEGYDKIMGMAPSYVPIYETPDGEYKIKANAPLKLGYTSEYLDFVFAHGNDKGMVIDDATLDVKSGVATVNKDAVHVSEDDYAEFQMQVLVPVDDVPVAMQHVTVENADGSIYEKNVRVYGMQMLQIPLAITGVEEDITSDDFTVQLNGVEVSSDRIVWDGEQKTLSVAGEFAANAYEVSIKVNKTVDAVFQTAYTDVPDGDTSYRNRAPMFYLGGNVDTSKLYVGARTQADIVWGGRAGDYRAYPPPNTIVTNQSIAFPKGSDFDSWGLGYVGIPRRLFGTDFIMTNASGQDYGEWSSSRADRPGYNMGVPAGCVHAGMPVSGWQDFFPMKFHIFDSWTANGMKHYAMSFIAVEALAKPHQSFGGILIFAVPELKAGLSIQKSYSDASVANGNSNYSLAGAVYGVYSNSSCTKLVTTLTTNASGEASTANDALDAGTYWIKEKTPSKGCGLDTTVHTITIEGGSTASVNVVKSKEPVKTGKVTLQKVSDNPAMTDGNGCYSLAGAVYGIWKTSDCKGTPYKTMTTDANGNASVGDLPFGTYYVQETKASPGFELDKRIYTLTITESNPNASIRSVEPAGNDPLGIEITKDWSGDDTVTIPSLEGTQFTVQYFDNMEGRTTGSPKRTWIIEIKWSDMWKKYMSDLDEQWLVAGSDPLYKDVDFPDITVLPYGTYKIWESKAAPDYDIIGRWETGDGQEIDIPTETNPYVAIVNKDTNGDIGLSGGNKYRGEDETVDMSITVKKLDANDKPLAGVTFKIVSESGYAEKQPGWQSEKTTGADGIVKWDNVYPDHYTITEIRTADNHNLLKDPIEVDLPGRMTKAEANKYHLVDPNPNDKHDGVVWDPYENVFYINDPVFEVGNDIQFHIPMTGGFMDITTFLPLMGGVGAMGLGAYGLTRKRKKRK
jgi:hypothetical protein